ncbi:RNA polymerase sigma factor [Lunatibacter salilacus]|uniref:RNA polymerase sigma factor n=1 Tax=Lunatibacter salilacus TaxID=2483804 RepID=UPI001F1BDA1E|nr:sigma-70 family RNA polymerase sigma factor [Lunatibacter salilacus]
MENRPNILLRDNFNPIPSGYSKSSDREVWDTFRLGNESAFITIYSTYFDELYRYGRRFVRQEQFLKDIIQDLFISLRKNRATLGGTDNIKFYLFKSLKRKIVKEEKRWINQTEQLPEEFQFDVYFSPEQMLIDRQISEEIANRINLALQQLSPRKKEVIYYFFFEELSYSQIQEIMKLDNIKSVRNLVYKALDFLRDILG